MTVPGTEYRPKGELEDWWKNHDPVRIFRERLKEMGCIDGSQAAEIDKQAEKEFEDAVDYALKSPEPQMELAFQDIYAGGMR